VKTMIQAAEVKIVGIGFVENRSQSDADGWLSMVTVIPSVDTPVADFQHVSHFDFEFDCAVDIDND